MFDSAIRAITSSLTISLGVPVRHSAELSRIEHDAARTALFESPERVVDVACDGDRYLAAIVQGMSDEVLVVGPFHQEREGASGTAVFSPSDEQRARRALDAAASGLRHIGGEPERSFELSRQMELLSNAVVAISGELQLEAVLRRITDLARNFAVAKYAALGIPDAEGRMETFITAGISDAEEARIAHPPEGLGLLGSLLRQRRPIRVTDIATHAESVGFPENHPPMKSFLGVPIVSRSGEIIGSLYLAEKRFADEFTLEDEMLIELLARHAAVAIENARLYRWLEQEERRLALLLDQLPEAVIVAQPDPPRVTFLNQHARRLLEIELALPFPTEALSDAYDMFNVRDEPIDYLDRPVMRSLIRREVIEREEVTAVPRSGHRRTFLVNCAPVDMHDENSPAVSVFQDITEIRDADRLKDDFLSLVSHELRTPLTTIQGGAQLLRQHAAALDEETRDELLTDINQESARLAALIQNMVQLTHIRAGRIALEPEPVLLRMPVARVVDQLRPLDPSRQFHVDVDPGAVAMADPDRVDEMLRNVIHNALKYTPSGTPIDVTAGISGDSIALAVRDYGPGIPEHDVPHLFERFERGSRASSDIPGMGLGLYLVRLLVEAQGGNVAIELPQDGGTRVVFRLPRAKAEM